jgi:hypothetical protein
MPFVVAGMIGAPYLPLLDRFREPLLDLAEVQPGQTLLDLGSGDGSLLLIAARRGVRCIGYEINPLLWAVSRVVTWRHRRLVTIRLCNYWATPIPQVDVIYVFLIHRYMARLDKKLCTEVVHPTSVVSMSFAIPGRIPDRTLPYAYRYRYDLNNPPPKMPSR